MPQGGVLSISDAKRQLPAVLRQSSEQLKVFRVGNARRAGAPRALILGEEAVRVLLGNRKLTLQWEYDEETGLWSVYAPELDVFGQGATREKAAEDLLETAKEYVLLYLEDPLFYFKAGRRDHFPYVLAIALAGDHPEQLRQVLGL